MAINLKEWWDQNQGGASPATGGINLQNWVKQNAPHLLPPTPVQIKPPPRVGLTNVLKEVPGVAKDVFGSFGKQALKSGSDVFQTGQVPIAAVGAYGGYVAGGITGQTNLYKEYQRQGMGAAQALLKISQEAGSEARQVVKNVYTNPEANIKPAAEQLARKAIKPNATVMDKIIGYGGTGFLKYSELVGNLFNLNIANKLFAARVKPTSERATFYPNQLAPGTFSDKLKASVQSAFAKNQPIRIQNPWAGDEFVQITPLRDGTVTLQTYQVSASPMEKLLNLGKRKPYIEGSVSVAPPTPQNVTPDRIINELDVSTTLNKQYSEFPKEQLFKPDGSLQPPLARGRIDDVAEKIDAAFPGKGLGDQLRSQVDADHIPSLDYLRKKALEVLQKAGVLPGQTVRAPLSLPAAAQIPPPVVARAAASVVPGSTPAPEPAPPTIQPTVQPQPPVTPQVPGQQVVPPRQPLTAAPVAPQQAPAAFSPAVRPSSAPQIAPQPPVAPPVPSPPAPPAPAVSVPSSPKIPTTQPTENNYYFYNPKTKSFTPIVGKKVEILPNIDTFSHKAVPTEQNPDGVGFTVTEGKTGLAIGNGATRQKAIARATTVLTDQYTQLPKILEDRVALTGVSPRYTEVAPKEAALSKQEAAAMKKQGFTPELIAKVEQAAQTGKAKPRMTLTSYVRPVSSLARFVRQHGGMSMEKETALRGELERLTNKETGTSGIVRSEGKTVDGMLESVRESKLFPNIETPNDLLAALEKDIQTGATKEMPAFTFTGTVKKISPGKVTVEKPSVVKTTSRGAAAFRETIARSEKVGKITAKEARMMTDIVNEVAKDGSLDSSSLEVWDRYVKGLFGGEPGVIKAGIYDTLKETARLAVKEARAQTGGLVRVTAHEITHPLLSQLSQETSNALMKQFHAERDRWLDTLTDKQRKLFQDTNFKPVEKGGLGPENYRWKNLEEYVAERGAEKRYAKAEFQETMRTGSLLEKIIAMVRRLLTALRTALQKATGDAFEQALSDWKKNPENPTFTSRPLRERTFSLEDLTSGKSEEEIVREVAAAYREAIAPNIEEVSLSTINIPRVQNLFDQHFDIERSVAENGYKEELMKGDIVLEKKGDRYNVASGAAVLRGIERRLAKGQDAPTTIRAYVRGTTPPVSPAARLAPGEATRIAIGPEMEKALAEISTESMPAETRTLISEVEHLAATLEANPDAAIKAVAKAVKGNRLLGLWNNPILGVPRDFLLEGFVQPHLHFPEVAPDVILGDVRWRSAAEDDKDLLKKIYRRFGAKVGSKEDALFTRFREKRLTAEDMKKDLTKTQELNKAATKELTDYFHEEAKKLGSIGYLEDYSPSGAARLPVFPESYEQSLKVNPSFFKKRKGEFVASGELFSTSMMRYARALRRKMYLEPKLLAAEEKIKTLQEQGVYSPRLAKAAMRYLRGVRNPYKAFGDADTVEFFKKMQSVETMITKTFAFAKLGIRYLEKNPAWAEGNTAGEFRMMYVSPKANKFLFSERAKEILREKGHGLVQTFLPEIYGTYGLSLESTTERYNKLMQAWPPSIVAKFEELAVRQRAFLLGWYRGEKLGLTGDDLEAHAHLAVAKTQQIALPSDMPAFYRLPLTRPLGQFILNSLKQANEILYKAGGLIGNTRYYKAQGFTDNASARKTAASFAAWFLVSSYALFALISSLQPKKTLMTRDGKEYFSGGIDALEGIDPVDLRRGIPAWNATHDPTVVLGIMTERVFAAPITKPFLHFFGGVSLASDKIYHKYKTGTEITLSDINPSPTSTYKDITTALEVWGWKRAADTDSSNLNTVVGLNGKLKGADEKEKKRLEKKYKHFLPLRDKGRSIDARVRFENAAFSEKNKVVRERLSAKGITEGEGKSLLKDNNSTHQKKLRELYKEFNQAFLDAFKKKSVEGQVSFVSSLFGIEKARAATVLDYTKKYDDLFGTTEVPKQYQLGVDTAKETKPILASPKMSQAAKTIATMEGWNKEASRSRRYNNPGNLVYAGQPGATRIQGEKFARFLTPALGMVALKRQILADARRGLTVQQFITKYAPPSENATSRYTQQFSAALGVRPRERLIDSLK